MGRDYQQYELTILAGVPGFEPRVTASEAVALPFGDTPKK